MKQIVQDCLALVVLGGCFWTCLLWMQLAEAGALS